MRKLTLEIEPNEDTRRSFGPQFENIHSYEVLETLKIDFDKGIFVDLIECTIKEGVSIEKLDHIGNMEILNIIGSNGNKYTCLVKGKESLDPGQSYQDLDLDLIWTKPSLISPEKLIISCIGSQESLMKFIDLIKKHGGEITQMTFQKAAYQNQDILKVLTDKQREIMTTAHRFGYYKYPRKINTEGLSKKVNITRATLVEHLRKAEVRILDEILTGYT